MAGSTLAPSAASRSGVSLFESRPCTALIAAALFALALAPRALSFGTFVTVDEAYHWFGRADSFLRALQQGDYAGTNLVGHPGVTTMWLGAMGILLHRSLATLGWVDLADPRVQRILLRMPVAVVTALCIALAYPLLRRLFGARIAMLAALLWATEPFLIAHSQLLHTDALLTSFMAMALLAAMVAFRVDGPDRPIRPGMLVASAVYAGLALLTKSPSPMLAPIV